MQRLEPPRRAADPVGERRAIERDALAGEDLRLAVERNVVAVFADDDVRQEACAGQPLRDWPLGCRGLMQLAACAATIFRATNTDDAQAGRNAVQHLADRLADLMDHSAAAGTGRGFDLERHVLALEMIRQTEPLLGSGLLQHVLGCDRRQRRLGSRDVGVEILKSEIELIRSRRSGRRPNWLRWNLPRYLLEPFDLARLGALVGTFRHERANHLHAAR